MRRVRAYVVIIGRQPTEVEVRQAIVLSAAPMGGIAVLERKVPTLRASGGTRRKR